MTVKPTYQGEMQLARASWSSSGGTTVTFFLPDYSDLEIFRGMTVRKGNRAGQRFAAVLVEIGDDEKPVDDNDDQLVEQVVKHWTEEQKKIDDPNYWTGPGLSKSLEQEVKAPDWHKDFADAPKPVSTGYQNIVGSDDKPKGVGLGELIEDPETREALDKAFKPKGGPHSQDAARICKSAEFQRFVNSRGGFDATENDAAHYMRDYCEIKSRAELDHNLDLGALQRFHRLMRKFNEWRERAA